MFFNMVCGLVPQSYVVTEYHVSYSCYHTPGTCFAVCSSLQTLGRNSDAFTITPSRPRQEKVDMLF